MKSIELAGQWKLRSRNGKFTTPATVPGDSHSALLACGIILDPYTSDNELALQALAQEDWIYERSFEVSEELIQERSVYLHCDSLDTIATVFINGQKVGTSQNMFVRQRFEIKEALRKGSNQLRIELASAETAAIAAAKKLPYPIPHNQMAVQSPHRNLIRKSQCHSGWDWGPCLMVAGIYGKIYIAATSIGRIEYVYTEQEHKESGVDVLVSVEVESPVGGTTSLNIELDGQKISAEITLQAGHNLLRRTVPISNPKLWWPLGIGEQPLYKLKVKVGEEEVRKQIGLRTIKLENLKDKLGASMTLYVNDEPIFCKGANWVPTDALPQRQTREVLEDLLNSVASANMNMLRVWGGGIYEPDDFYDLCDEKGILVWHDFMFACALYPATADFLDSVRQEARHQVKRLHDHPSLALWCGNNENIGALRWYPESIANRDLYITEYDRLNEGVLGQTVRELDPSRPFWPSSPCGGAGDYSNCWDFDGRGDMHYWNVWFNSAPLEKYLEIKPRFHSEFGFQSLPSLETIRTFAAPDQWNITSPIMEHHQRNDFGFARILETFTRYFRIPEGFENTIYLSQVQQTLAMKIGVEYWRRLRPICMGALYWQLNDVWPVTSCSSLEYKGKWKMMHYAARRFFAPHLISVTQQEDQIEIWGTNDQLQSVEGPVRLRVIGLDGKVLKTLNFTASVGRGSSTLLQKYPVNELVTDPSQAFLVVEWQLKSGLIRNEHFFTTYKKMKLPQPKISTAIKSTSSGFAVTLESDLPALWVQVNANEIRGEFDDNGFALLPNEPRQLQFTVKEKVSLEEFQEAFRLRHLRDTYA